jgi:DNA polymerase III subunit epsilon
MKKNLYAIVDIETTGGTAAKERITEIAIVLHDGEKVVDTYETLLNPERSIPYNITRITGISDEMVADAPRFYEVAKKIVQFTEGAIFVAHNVRFDYSFVQAEFQRLGYAYTRKQLCTVRLSRKAFPGLSSYALGNLITHFRLKVNARHRAMADAAATAEIFEKILRIEPNVEALQDMVNLGIKESKLPKDIDLEKLHQLPETCGVYYLHDQKGEVIYVGKSINIKKRIFEHFNDKTDKGGKLKQAVADITYETTGSELVALLLESYEIKRLLPRINKAQRRVHFPYCIYHYTQEGFLRLHASKNVTAVRKKNTVIAEFGKLLEAKSFLKSVVQQYQLCESLTDPHAELGKPCFRYQLSSCHGACVGKETPETYNERVLEALTRIDQRFDHDFIVLDGGRTPRERAVVLVQDGSYRGFGYIDADDNLTIEDLLEAIGTRPSNADTNRIVRLFISQLPKSAKVIKF